jgi:hypothetical protein
MAARSTTQIHHLEEPHTGLLYGTRPDGSHTLTAAPHRALRFSTNTAAAEYRADRLPNEPAEIVRVTA